MRLNFAPRAPASWPQKILRVWALFTAAWYLFVTAVVVLTGDADVTPVLLGLVAFVVSGPIVFTWGCLSWTTQEGWIARCVGLILMIGGFVPLAFFSALVLPAVLLSLPAAWRWRDGRAVFVPAAP